MKKQIILFAALCSLALLYSSCTAYSLRGSGNIVRQSSPTQSFDAVTASRAVEVILSNSVDEIVLEADDNIIDKIEVKCSDNTINISIDKSYRRISDMTARVFLPVRGNTINCLAVSSSAEIKTEGTLQADSISLLASSSGEITASIIARACTIAAASGSEMDLTLSDNSYCMATAASGADIEIKGQSLCFSAAAASGAEINALEFIAQECSAAAASGSEIELFCTKQLNASAASGADIYFKGDVTDIKASRASGGKIKRLN